MTSAGGLSRRRGGGGPSSTTALDDEDNISHSRSATSPSPTPASAGIGGSAFAFTSSGSKIAFDPRDLEDAEGEEKRSGGKIPKLTIMEEVLLLGIKDKQGYLSFWNDNISYALRGCILIELALRRRIALVRDPSRKRIALPDRLVEVTSTAPTGETILDETLRMMKGQQEPPGGQPGEKMSVNSWVDLLSGETWNVLKIGFQLKQVRERLAKGLVDKGVLRTEKRNFLLFDMATHPVADSKTKDGILRRLGALLSSTTSTVPPQALGKEGEQCRVLRAVCLTCAAYAASVLDNAFVGAGYEEQEAAFTRAEEILAEFSAWPWGAGNANGSMSGADAAKTRRRAANRIASGSSGDAGRESVLGLIQEAKKESIDPAGFDDDVSFELIAGVLEVLGRLDSLL